MTDSKAVTGKRSLLPIDRTPELDSDLDKIVSIRRSTQPGYKKRDAIREAIRNLRIQLETSNS